MKCYLFRTLTSSNYALINSRKRLIVWQPHEVLLKHRSTGELTLGHWIPIGTAGKQRIEWEYKIKPLAQIHAFLGKVNVEVNNEYGEFIELYKTVLNSLPDVSEEEIKRVRKLMNTLPPIERVRLATELFKLQSVLVNFKKVFNI